MEISWTQQALSSLEDVFQYGTRFSREMAIDYVDELISFCESLKEFPLRFPTCPELPHPEGIYRHAIFERQYRVIYKIDKNSRRLIVLDIFHTSRSPDRIKRLTDE